MRSQCVESASSHQPAMTTRAARFFGSLPPVWNCRQVSEITKRVTVGIVINPSRWYAQTGVPAFRSQNVREGAVNDNGWVYLTEEGNALHSKSITREGDVLVVRSGAPGTACVVPGSFAGYNCIDLVIVRPDNDLVLSEFLCEFINSDVGKRQVAEMQGGLALQHFNVSECAKLWCPVPPKAEQRRIVAVLSAWDRGIGAMERLVALKTRRKRALMQQLLTGKRRFPEFSEPWKTYRLGDVFKERNEADRPELRLLSITADRGVIDRTEIERKDTSNVDKSRYKRLAPGDIGYNTMRMWQGVSALSTLEGIVSPAYTVVLPGPKVCAEYVAYFFKFTPMVHLFYRYSQGLVDDTRNLKFKHFAEIKVQLPEVEEQQRIAAVLRTCDDEIDLLTSQLDALRQQKKGLMQKLLTGEVRVKEEG